MLAELLDHSAMAPYRKSVPNLALFKSNPTYSNYQASKILFVVVVVVVVVAVVVVVVVVHLFFIFGGQTSIFP